MIYATPPSMHDTASAMSGPGSLEGGVMIF